MTSEREDLRGRRKECKEELHNLSTVTYFRVIKSSRTIYAERVARMGKKRNTYRVLMGKEEGKGPLGRPRNRWKDNIKAAV